MIYNDHILGATGPKGSLDEDLEIDTQTTQNVFTDALNAMLQKDRIPTDTNTNENSNPNDWGNNNHHDNDDDDALYALETPPIHTAPSITSSMTTSTDTPFTKDSNLAGHSFCNWT